jgi:hypothetical protein
MPWGFGLHLSDIDSSLPKSQVLERARLQTWLGELFYAFSLGFSQLAILGFYWRMFKTSNIKRPIWMLGVGVIIWLLCRVCASSIPELHNTGARLIPSDFPLHLPLLSYRGLLGQIRRSDLSSQRREVHVQHHSHSLDSRSHDSGPAYHPSAEAKASDNSENRHHCHVHVRHFVCLKLWTAVEIDVS